MLLFLSWKSRADELDWKEVARVIYNKVRLTGTCVAFVKDRGPVVMLFLDCEYDKI